MKTAHADCWLALCLSLLILQSAVAENIVSRPVGFLRISAPSNAQVLASQPFSPLDESNSEAILKWDIASGYTSSTTVAEPGEGFWLVNDPSSNRTVCLKGEVVLTSSNTARLYPGLNLVGYPYSSPLPLNQTALGSLTTSVEILNADAKTPGETESVLGKGYWVKSLSEECIVWTEVRPYENVFPESGLPEITAITTASGSNVVLSIACEGDEALDVFYQDIQSTNGFEAVRDWQVAEAGILANGQASIEWSDAGSNERPAPGEIPGRYYLVGRADIDLDGNGVPDARDQFVNGASPANEASGSLVSAAVLVEETEESSFTSPESDAAKAESTNSKPIQAINVGRVIYVDRNSGSDLFTGRAALVVSGDGPKKTIRSGVNAATQPGDMVVIRQGQYSEDLNVVGRDIRVVISGRVNLCGVENAGVESPPGTDSITNSQTGENNE